MYVFDYKGDAYGKYVEIEFCAFERPESRFASLEELKTQVDRDILFGMVVYEEREEKTKLSYKADLSDFVGLYYFDIDSWNRTDGVVRFSFFETGSF